MIEITKQIAIQSKVRRELTAIDFADSEVKDFFVTKYAKGASDIELAEFISTAIADEAVPGEDIYFIKYGNNPGSIQHSINWMTRKANESGDFVGFTDPEYQDKNGNWSKFWESKQQAPHACRIGIIKRGTDKIGYSTVRWDERFKDQAQWKSGAQPIHMLTKCAKAQALRDGGFKGCRGRYIVEEMLHDDLPASGEWVADPNKSNIENAIDHGRVAKEAQINKRILEKGDLSGKPTDDQSDEYQGWKEVIEPEVIKRIFIKLGFKGIKGLSRTEYESVLVELRKEGSPPQNTSGQIDLTEDPDLNKA